MSKLTSTMRFLLLFVVGGYATLASAQSMTVDGGKWVKGLHFNSASKRQEASFGFTVVPNATETHCIWHVDGVQRNEFYDQMHADITFVGTGKHSVGAA